MVDVEERLRPVRPRASTGRSVSYRDIPTLYLEDITKIYRIMSDANREYTGTRIVREAKRATQLLNRRLVENNEVLGQLAEKLHADVSLPNVEELDLGEPDHETIENETIPVHLESDEYEFDSLEEFRSLRRDKIRKLSMRTDDFRISLRCADYAVSVDASEEDAETLTAFSHIQDVLEPRRHRYWRVIHSTKAVLAILVVITLAWFVAFMYIPVVRAYAWSGVAIQMLLIALLVISEVYWGRRPVVVPKNLVDAPGFWKKHGLEIFLLILGAIAGAIATRLIGKP